MGIMIDHLSIPKNCACISERASNHIFVPNESVRHLNYRINHGISSEGLEIDQGAF